MQEITQACAVALGQAVRRARKEKGFSQEEFAFACDLDRSYVGQVERGENNISLETILYLAKGLGCRPSEIFKHAGY